jgi:branched-chain amino acid transport system ATP-binding protein
MSILEVKGLTRSFGGLVAVNGVDFDIEEGEIFGMIGPNGSGKTTIFNLITSFYPKDKGTIIFKKEDITNLRTDQICKRGVSRTFQIAKPLLQITVLQNVAIGALNRAKDVITAKRLAMEILEFTGLGKKRDQLAQNLSTPERKRLELAKALATEPKLLLLDEVMSGLTLKEREETMTLIRNINRQGITIFVIEHVMKAIMPLSHRIIVLNYGEKIAIGTPLEISKDQRVVKAYLGKEYQFASPRRD